MLTESELHSTRGTAVIIEDDLDIRNLMCAVLRQAGFDVHPAATGLAGVELARSTEAALVTIDIALPDIDGHEVLQRIRRFSDCPVVVVTGRTDQVDIATAFRWGADEYLGKPFRPRELSACIDVVSQRLLDGSGHDTPAYNRDSVPAGSTVRRSVRRPTEGRCSPAFLPATAGRTHATSMETV